MVGELPSPHALEEETLKAVAFPLLPAAAATAAERLLLQLGRHWNEGMEVRSVVRFCVGVLAPLILGARLMQVNPKLQQQQQQQQQ